MSEQGLIQAERRVREMNRVTRQYTEQGNRFMQQLQQAQQERQGQQAQQMQNMQNMRNNQTRFEQVVPNNSTYNPNGNNAANAMNGISSTGGTNGAQNSQHLKGQNGSQRQQNMRGSHNTNNAPATQTSQAAQNFQNQQAVRFETAPHNTAGRNYSAGNAPVWNPSSGNSMAGMLSFLSDLNLDGEKLMIILIMYLLIKEKADIKLILALGYLLF